MQTAALFKSGHILPASRLLPIGLHVKHVLVVETKKAECESSLRQSRTSWIDRNKVFHTATVSCPKTNNLDSFFSCKNPWLCSSGSITSSPGACKRLCVRQRQQGKSYLVAKWGSCKVELHRRLTGGRIWDWEMRLLAWLVLRLSAVTSAQVTW